MQCGAAAAVQLVLRSSRDTVQHAGIGIGNAGRWAQLLQTLPSRGAAATDDAAEVLCREAYFHVCRARPGSAQFCADRPAAAHDRRPNRRARLLALGASCVRSITPSVALRLAVLMGRPCALQV